MLRKLIKRLLDKVLNYRVLRPPLWHYRFCWCLSTNTYIANLTTLLDIKLTALHLNVDPRSLQGLCVQIAVGYRKMYSNSSLRNWLSLFHDLSKCDVYKCYFILVNIISPICSKYSKVYVCNWGKVTAFQLFTTFICILPFSDVTKMQN